MKTEDEETTLHDDMAAAISELEAKGDTTVADAVDKLEPTKQERGADGKFKGKTEEEEEKGTEEVKKEETDKGTEEQVKKVEEQQPLGGDPEKILSQDKAPSSWTPKARESWATLPEDARKEILRREEDSVKGIRQLQEQMAPYTQFAHSLEPFIKEALDGNKNPAQYISDVMHAERRLRTGDAEQRFSALVEIAEGYGIPLRKIINDAMGTELIPHPSLTNKSPSIPPEVQRELEESRKFRQEQLTAQEQESIRAIEEFKKDKEFFDDVSVDMGALMEMGRATTLQEAYDKACQIHPQVSEILRERASKPPLNDKQKAAASLKGTSSNSAETADNDFDDDDDTETTIRKAFSKAAGRV